MIILNVNVNLTLHLSFSGCTVGSIVTMPISGLLTRYDFDGGWPAVFYSFGKSPRLKRKQFLLFLRLHQLTFEVYSSQLSYRQQRTAERLCEIFNFKVYFHPARFVIVCLVQKLYRLRCKPIGPLKISPQEYCREWSMLPRLRLSRSLYILFLHRSVRYPVVCGVVCIGVRVAICSSNYNRR